MAAKTKKATPMAITETGFMKNNGTSVYVPNEWGCGYQLGTILDNDGGVTYPVAPSA